MSSSQFVSVLMPAYNASAYIADSIESVINQTHKNWELIIVNDGSSDSTQEIIQHFLNRDHRIRSYRNEVNQGLGFTTNRALQYAKGSYIAKLDSDDTADTQWLKSRLEYLEANPDVLAVTGSRTLIDSKGNIIAKLDESWSIPVIRWKLMLGNPIIHPGIVFKANDAYSYQPFRYLEDWDLWAKIIVKGDIVVLPDRKINYRIHVSNTSSKLGKNNEQLRTIVENIVSGQTVHYFDFKPDREIIWYLYRDRAPFAGEKRVAENAIVILEDLFLKFCEKHNAEIDGKSDKELKVALWDEISHIIRVAPVKSALIWKLFRSYPMGTTLIREKRSRKVLAKLLYLFCLNVIK